MKVRNNKKEQITIQLKNQIPVSSHKDLEIKLLERGKANFNTQQGVLTWQLEIAPNETKTVSFSYSLKYAKWISLSF